MNYLLTATCLVAFLSAPQEGAAQDAVRFPALQADQLTPDQKKWADTITAPPRNGKFANPPYRAYPQSGAGNAADAAVGLSAVEYVTAGAAERTRNPHHRPPLDRAIRVVRPLSACDQSRS